MKKTIVIVILAVFIASIAVVNFFGLEVKMFDSITYVTGIQCDTVTVHRIPSLELRPTTYIGNTPLFQFDFIPAPDGEEYTADDESVSFNPNAIELNYVVFPHLADSTEIKFEYDEQSMSGVAVFLEDKNTLIFLKPDIIFTITIRATDGSNVSTTVAIRGKTVQ